MAQFGGAYRDRRVLITGHTGFKGSWLSLWLHRLGADLTGVALDPESTPNHWQLLDLPVEDRRVDVRDASGVLRVVSESRPQIVFHLAAQPLVRRSYREPQANWDTNVMGTVNLLEACRLVGGVSAVVVVTTDKVYANNEWAWGYREIDPLGGHDPYSASKAATELVVQSYRRAFFGRASSTLVASARAGNVIGGGDWSEDRLIPDIVRAIQNGQVMMVRSPGATRPWQHVLDCLSGYLSLGQQLLAGMEDRAEAWNFGPSIDDNRTVGEVLGSLRGYWPELEWQQAECRDLHEAKLLYLDSAKARARLGWCPVWSLERCLETTAAWYRSFLADGRVESDCQLEQYVAEARAAGVNWARE